MSFEVVDPAHPTLAVVIEGPRLVAGLVAPDDEVIVRDRVATPTRDVWPSLESMTRRVLAAAPADTPPPSAVAVTSETPIDTRAGSISPPSIPLWRNFPIRERLAEMTGLPVALDSVAGAAAEARAALETRGAEPGDQGPSFLEVHLGPAVDSAIVVANRRLRGAHGNAGSIAHVQVEPSGRACWCGAGGCLAAYVATTVIERELNRPLKRAPRSVVERSGILLGRALASVAATVDLDRACLSGALVDAFGAPLLMAARGEIDARARLPMTVGLELDLSPPPSPLVAAAAIARSEQAAWLETG